MQQQLRGDLSFFEALFLETTQQLEAHQARCWPQERSKNFNLRTNCRIYKLLGGMCESNYDRYWMYLGPLLARINSG